MTIIPVQDYSIFVNSDLEALHAFVKNAAYSRLFVLVDENTEAHCLPFIQEILKDYDLEIIRIRSGESHKNIVTCQQIWHTLLEKKADRHALFLNLGGGVIGDMGGFCARTYKRGMDFVQIPTTLLSQVDASIGGKLGIDFGNIKNSIGLFANPKAIFIETNFLQTLPAREIRSGFAEIIKHSLIADADQWQYLQKITNPATHTSWDGVLVPSLQIKKGIVQTDPFEKGIRKALNFGHTIGHAIESFALSSRTPLLHGEAIAVGMVCEAYLSHRLVGLSAQALKHIRQFVKQIYPPFTWSDADLPALLQLMQNDKKNKGGVINFTLLPRIGACEIDQSCSRALIAESLDFYRKGKR